MNTEAINHDPAITFINTGTQQPGKPSMGAWLSYGLGSANKNLPAYVVMISRGKGNLQALYARLWGSGFLPSQHQGVKLRRRATRCSTFRTRRGFRRDDRRAIARRAGGAEREEFGEVWRPGDRDADRAVRDGVSDADGGTGAVGYRGRAGIDFRPLRGAGEAAGDLCGELPAGAAAGGARGAVHPAFPPGLGPAREPAEPTARAVRGYRPGIGRAGARI